MPDAELMKGVGKVQCRFIGFACPIVDCVCTRPRAEAAVGQWAWLATGVQHVDKSLGREVGVQCEVNEDWVHDDGEPSFALLNDGDFEDILIVADGFVVSVFGECFKVLVRCL